MSKLQENERFARTKIPLRTKVPSRGKENERSSTSARNAKTRLLVDAELEQRRTGGSVAGNRFVRNSESERKDERSDAIRKNGGSRGAVGFPVAKKAPFHVHCDQRANVVSRQKRSSSTARAPTKNPPSTDALDRDDRCERRRVSREPSAILPTPIPTPLPSLRARGKSSGKDLRPPSSYLATGDVAEEGEGREKTVRRSSRSRSESTRDHGKIVPLRKRLSRSTSASGGDPALPPRRSRWLAAGIVQRPSQVLRTTVKGGPKNSSKTSLKGTSNAERKGARRRDVGRPRDAAERAERFEEARTNAGTRAREPSVDRGEKRPKRPVERETMVRARRGAGRIETPIDVPRSMLPLPAKTLARRAERAGEKDHARRLEAGATKRRKEGAALRERDAFPDELLHNLEYREDLYAVEAEREERSPRLSVNFLNDRFNAEQRKLVIVFFLRLSTRCSYPSYVVHQAAKLFDVAMDRLLVDTAYIQLTALAALWIALKRQENFHKIPSATTMVALAEDLYAGREDLLIAYERKILSAVDFDLAFADAFSLLTCLLIDCNRYMNMLPETIKFLRSSGGYLIDLALLDEQFCRVSASLLVSATTELILGLALDATDVDTRPRWKFWRAVLVVASPRAGRFRDEEIDALRVAMIRRLVCSDGRRSDFEVVYKKYSRGRYGRISAMLLERVKRISYAEMLDP